MQDFFKIACEEAEQGMLAGEGGPFGAVVVKDGKVIGKGHNCVFSLHDSTAHAEIMAIRNAEQAQVRHDLTGCVIYTTCYPCPMCLGAIMWARISKVYYGCTADEAAAIGFDDKVFHLAFSNPDDYSIVSMEYHDDPRCGLLFQKWLELENRLLY
ncbi:MAG: nucleoside deaminase [Dehalococcoidia bacterium]|nr:nucleoside deaminase [Dehalococcoidia bacterium]